MKAYAQYKPSGSEWLGNVPTHWDVARLRFRAKLNPGATRPLLDTEVVSFLPMDAIGDDGELELEHFRSVVDVSSGYTYFEDGDVAMAKITPCYENGKGAVMRGLRGGVGFGTTELIVMRPQDDVVPRWLYYLTMCDVFRVPGEAMMLGAGGQKRVPDLFVKDYYAAFPPLSEQQAVADYLDTETARIDHLIREKEGLLGFLDEARTAAISGLLAGESLPGSASGNEWIPHLPHGWQIQRLKFVAIVQSGIAKGKDNENRETVEVPYLRVANVQDGHLDLEEVLTIEVPVEQVERFSLQKGDVLMNEGGDYDKLGRGAVWQSQIAPCVHQNHVYAVRPVEADVSDWLAALTQTKYARFYFMNNAKQSTNLASISQKNVKEFPVLLPPLAVRTALLQTVREQTKAIDDLVRHAKAEIDLLKELRTATIADAVLGRIDVRTAKQQH